MVILSILRLINFSTALLASEIEIVKLQETQRGYDGTFDSYDLSTKTTGWEVCKKYAVGLWIKKNSWVGGWETHVRFSSTP